MSTHQHAKQWRATNTITSNENLFCCLSGVAFSSRHNKLFVATYDEVECWSTCTCIQVFNIVQNGEETNYSYMGRMLVRGNPYTLCCVSHEEDDSLLVSCTATNSLYRYEVSDLLENAFDDDSYTCEQVWKVGGGESESEPVFRFIIGMDTALNEQGERIVFVCDEAKNRIVVIDFKTGSLIRYLSGQPKNEEQTELTNIYSFKSISHISVKQQGTEYVLFVSEMKNNFRIVLKDLMSTEIIETKMEFYGAVSSIDHSKNQILYADDSTNTFNVVDLETLQLVHSTQDLKLGKNLVYMHLDSASHTLYIASYDKSILVCKDDSQ